MNLFVYPSKSIHDFGHAAEIAESIMDRIDPFRTVTRECRPRGADRLGIVGEANPDALRMSLTCRKLNGDPVYLERMEWK